MPALSPARQTLLLFLLALAVLLPGIWEATGLTGKDEFFLGLRTPMEMIEGDHWLVPFLDGAPRIRKPPLLYWAGRASYEIFGISLTSARLVSVLFAALLIVSTAGIARRLSGKSDTGLIAGGILLGCLGMASEARRLMLDVPVSALSAAAFWSLLVWLDSGKKRWLTATSVLLAAGFLTKGPIVALVFGGGCLALLAGGRLSLARLRRQFLPIAGHALLFAALALPWFFIVRALYPDAAELVLSAELESRQFFNFSPGIVLGLLNVALPWVFVFVAAAWAAGKRPGLERLVLIWFLATFLPFAFIKSFDRYLIGSLVPLAILIALSLPEMHKRWPFRLGLALAPAAGRRTGRLQFLVRPWRLVLADPACRLFRLGLVATAQSSPHPGRARHLLDDPALGGFSGDRRQRRSRKRPRTRAQPRYRPVRRPATGAAAHPQPAHAPPLRNDGSP